MLGGGIFFLFSLLLIITILARSVGAGSILDNNEQYNELISSISSIKKHLQDSSIEKRERALLWIQLGSLLTFKDVRYHEDGILTREEALHSFDEAIAVKLGDTQVEMVAYHKRGMLLKMMGQGKEAIHSHNMAYTLATNDAERSVCLQFKASAVSMLGDAKGAIDLYREALKLTPSQLGIYYPLSASLNEVGQTTEEWMTLFQEMEQFAREYDTEEMIDDEQAALQFEYAPGTSSTQFHWALYLVAEKAKDFKTAWKSLQLAHEIQIQNVGLISNSEVVMEQKDKILATFTPGFWNPVIGYPTKTPVFVIGMMRSGSTLMETMLDAHPMVWGLGEDSVFNSRLPKFQKDFVAAVNKGDMKSANGVIAKYGEEILTKMKFGLGSDATINKEKKKNVVRIVDKMLFNYNNIGMLHMIYPDAPIINMIRDPLDCLFSQYKHKFDEAGLRWTLTFDGIVDHYVAYLEILAHFRKVLPGRVYDVRYEELVNEPEKVMHGVLEHIGIPWDPSILEFYASNRSVQTFSSSQVRQKLYTKSMGSWTRYATELEPLIKRFKKHIPRLSKAGALVFNDVINYQMDPSFPYPSTTTAPPGTASTASKSRATTAKLSTVSIDHTGDVMNDAEDDDSDEIVAVRSSKKKKKKTKKTRKPSKSTTAGKRSGKQRTSSKRKSKRRAQSSETEGGILQQESPRIQQKKRKLKSKDSTLAGLKVICAKSVSMPESQQLGLVSTFDYPTEDKEAGKLIACSYMLLQMRILQPAHEILSGVLRYNPDLYQAYIAMSGHYQLSGEHQKSLQTINQLLKKRPNDLRALQQRADVLTSLKLYDQSIVDWTYVLEYQKTAQVYYGRGLCYFHKKNFYKAYDDFLKATELKGDARNYNALGKVLKEFGRDLDAVEAQKKALAYDPRYREAALDAAIGYMSQSRMNESLVYLDKALAIDPNFMTAYGWRALLYDNLGHSHAVIRDVYKVLSYDPNQIASVLLGATTHWGLGLYRKSVELLDDALRRDPRHSCWFKREIIYFYLKHVDDNVLTFNLNKAIHPRIKEGFATSSEDPPSFMREYPEYRSLAIENARYLKGEDIQPELPKQGVELLQITAKLANFIQVRSPGFTPHARHYRMFGLAVLQAAQTLRMHVATIKNGGTGLEVPDSYSSHSDGITLNVIKPNHHIFGWRDLFDIIIRWRQLSAPGDPIWWTDQLTQKQYSERQGMTTYMLNGVGVNTRYGPYADFAFNVTKEILLQDGYLANSGSATTSITDQKKRDMIKDATHVSELYDAIGSGFYVVVPCYSINNPGRVMNGTMIRLEKSHLDGWDFGICTATSFDRYMNYEEELAAVFQRIVKILVNQEHISVEVRREVMAKYTLELFFYWIQFTPITRGTSATGYAAILSCILALGEQIDDNIPEGKQLDWEGILTPHPEDFIARILPWISNRSKTDISDKWLNGAPGYKLVEIFDTTRKMIAAINGVSND